MSAIVIRVATQQRTCRRRQSQCEINAPRTDLNAILYPPSNAIAVISIFQAVSYVLTGSTSVLSKLQTPPARPVNKPANIQATVLSYVVVNCPAHSGTENPPRYVFESYRGSFFHHHEQRSVRAQIGNPLEYYTSTSVASST